MHPLLATRSPHWFEAIFERHSTRTYSGEPVDEATLSALEQFCTGFRPYDDCRIELVRDPGTRLFRGIVGSYGKVTGSPHALVMIAGVGDEAQQHVGYSGEAALLEATSLGLATCWVGGFFNRRVLRDLIELDVHERAYAVSPVGLPAATESSGGIALSRMVKSHSRVPAEKIAEDYGDGWPLWARSAVECARLAPSAMNRQPWRFRLHEGDLVIRKTMGELPVVSKDLDCGIAMLHAQIAARESGVQGEWKSWTEQGDLARFYAEAPVS